MNIVDWRYVLPVAIAAVVGGYGSAGFATRIGRGAIRRFGNVVGFAMSLVLFFRYDLRRGCAERIPDL
jgi:uncharacterized membrane protein YfcA